MAQAYFLLGDGSGCSTTRAGTNVQLERLSLASTAQVANLRFRVVR